MKTYPVIRQIKDDIRFFKHTFSTNWSMVLPSGRVLVNKKNKEMKRMMTYVQDGDILCPLTEQSDSYLEGIKEELYKMVQDSMFLEFRRVGLA